MFNFNNLFTGYLKKNTSPFAAGIARSLLAFGLLLTLAFNNIHTLVPQKYISLLDTNSVSYCSNFFFLLGASHLEAMSVIAIIILLIVISGYFMQVTCLLHLWVTASFILIRSSYIGGDNVNMLLALLLVPVCIFDTRRNHWNRPDETNSISSTIQSFFLFFIKMQVAWIYFDSVFLKLHVQEWRNGTVMYYWFTNSFFGLNERLQNTFKPFLDSYPVIASITWGTLIFEAILCIGFLLPPRARKILLISGIAFHFMIILVHGFFLFFFAMSSALILYLSPVPILKKRKAHLVL